MKDVEIKTNHSKFKYRVNGLVINNNRLLTLKMSNNTSYCLPGGHVELGEDTHTAIIREMAEELNTNVTIQSEFAFVETFYADKNNLKTHELSLYYVVEPENYDNIPLTNYTIEELDNGVLKKHNFVWLDIADINNVDFRPSFIKEKLASNNFDFEHIIITD